MDGGPIQPSTRSRRPRPRRLTQLAVGFATVVFGVILAVLAVYSKPDAASAKAVPRVYELQWRLPAHALNLGRDVGGLGLARESSSLVTMVRRPLSIYKRAAAGGRTRPVAIDPTEDASRHPGATDVETAHPGKVDVPPTTSVPVASERTVRLEAMSPGAAAVEAVDATAVHAPAPVSRPAHVDPMIPLEAMAPRLRHHVDGFDWARVPEEWPLFRVFDETDSDVVPPGTHAIPLRDDLRVVWSTGLGGNGQSRPASGSRDVGLVEVTISERGEVERARLVSAPSSIHGSMLLSVVKAWKFSPAMKDGHPVRYRQVIPIIAAR